MVADLAARLTSDPLLSYSLLAAAVLGASSLVGGWGRGDLRALSRPTPWIAVALAALAALAITVAGDRIEAVDPGAWPVPGIRRLPLYLVALGYGPTSGAIAALLFAGIERFQGPVPAADAVLVLEMAVVGWLAIAPSPRRFRFAASFGVLSGWALAMSTGGLAALAWAYRPLPLETWAATMRADLPGVLASAVLLALLPPRWWRSAAPGASPGVTGVAAGAARRRGRRAGDDAEPVIPALRREGPRRVREEPAPPVLPAPMVRTAREERAPTAAAVPADPMTREDPDDVAREPAESRE